jgi:hypothetical protein
MSERRAALVNRSTVLMGVPSWKYSAATVTEPLTQNQSLNGRRESNCREALPKDAGIKLKTRAEREPPLSLLSRGLARF